MFGREKEQSSVRHKWRDFWRYSEEYTEWVVDSYIFLTVGQKNIFFPYWPSCINTDYQNSMNYFDRQLFFESNFINWNDFRNIAFNLFRIQHYINSFNSSFMTTKFHENTRNSKSSIVNRESNMIWWISNNLNMKVFLYFLMKWTISKLFHTEQSFLKIRQIGLLSSIQLCREHRQNFNFC